LTAARPGTIPALGRVNAAHPALVGAATGAVLAVWVLVFGRHLIPALLIGLLVGTLFYGNGKLLAAYLARGGRFADGQGK
jgi:hypothetical protein